MFFRSQRIPTFCGFFELEILILKRRGRCWFTPLPGENCTTLTDCLRHTQPLISLKPITQGAGTILTEVSGCEYYTSSFCLGISRGSFIYKDSCIIDMHVDYHFTKDLVYGFCLWLLNQTLFCVHDALFTCIILCYCVVKCLKILLLVVVFWTFSAGHFVGGRVQAIVLH